MKTTASAACPCGGKDYAACCGRYIDDGELPQTAEQLMRSRYTAYTRRDEAYLKHTWHPETRPAEDLTQDDGGKWLGLEVRRHEQDGDSAIVEFVARYKVGGRAHRMHEVSRFRREGGKWFYVDGSFPEGR
ncbi:MAG TPA: YchJ family metal-binding protein [Noviherbaspirillum sp.]|jgi:SEC-C motif-containing protein|uniref:YchJ family protein n=1 Tax=Noviherbaspirillum sp. TaxID=1926288 RepID=UPI002F926D22